MAFIFYFIYCIKVRQKYILNYQSSQQYHILAVFIKQSIQFNCIYHSKMVKL